MVDRICIIRQRDEYELPVRREAEALLAAGFDVDVICLQQEGHENVEEINGVTIYRLPLRRKKTNILRYMWDYGTFFLLAALKLTRLHFKHRYKVIQVNTMPDFLVFVTLIPRIFGAKTIAFMKEPVPELSTTLYNSRFMNFILRMVEKMVLKYAHLSFTVTQELKDTFVARGANPDKIHVVLNGPDARHLLSMKNGVQPDPEHFTLICHGAVEERYGHDTIVRGFELAQKRVPNLRLRILGAGSYVDELKALLEKSECNGSAQYLGWVSDQTVVDELSKADVGIVAQKSSPYSNLVHTNKMYEYILFGKPALVTRLHSVSCYFHEDSVCFFEPDNPESLADAIVALHEDPARRKTLVENSQKLYQDYCWERQAKILVGGHRKVLERK